ncbi:MAG: aminotransferase class I/II-fold pyridoxal phosphate-dependent enzyme [Thaumarchaeota archaeon]|nr:aminotransferase class I/II-fold pyridoxal phosphate-dependent enzyme [Nitrososphaerota archaeon]
MTDKGEGSRSSKRVQLFTESVIREMTRLADECGAINLAQGMPDFEAPSRVKAAATKAIMEDLNQYETTWGSAGLREAIAEKALRFNRIQANPETDVTVTCGSTEAMTVSIIATVDVGGEVIIPEPFYENYVPATIIAGAKPRHVKLSEEGQSFDEEELKAAFSSRTKAIIVNTPNNPSGKVLNKDELKLVADLCADYDAIAITDEIYEHIIYDGRKHISLASLDGMSDRTITISGLSKTYSVTGWRVGYAIAAKEITNAIRKVHDYTTVCAPTPFQKAGIEALKLPQSHYTRLAKEYQRRRDFVVKSLQNIGFRAASPEGAYYVLADFSSISAMDDTSFARNLTKNAKVAAVPGSSFYAHREMGRSKVRFSFAKRDQTLREAMNRLNRFAAKLRS